MNKEIKELTREESLKYYDDDEYREEINLNYKKILVNLSGCHNIVNVSTYVIFKGL